MFAVMLEKDNIQVKKLDYRSESDAPPTTVFSYREWTQGVGGAMYHFLPTITMHESEMSNIIVGVVPKQPCKLNILYLVLI